MCAQIVNLSKRLSFIGPNLLVFVSPGMKNHTTSGDARSEALLALLKANSMTASLRGSSKRNLSWTNVT